MAVGRPLRLAAFLFAVAFAPEDVAAGEERTVKIGVLAYRGAAHAIRSWAPTADYLSARIPGYRFTIVPLPLEELRRETARGAFEFVFTNSGQYVELESEFGISRIATLKTRFGGEASNVFGAVIFTRADRSDVRELQDLRDKSFAAVAPKAFGGFQMAWRELHELGIDPFTDFSSLIFVGLPQDRIVYAVRDGLADAGTVRTHVLETMHAEGKIDISTFRILHRREMPGRSAALSTRLYPEWPFAKLPGTSPELAEKVAIALLGMSRHSPAMRAAGYAGWTVPLDYKPVHDLFRELRIGPYARERVSLYEFVRQYWEWAVFALVILALVGLHGVRTEYLVARRTRELSAINAELEREIAERRRAEARARRHEAELAHVSRVSLMGEMASGLAHELNQPLSAISSYAQGCVRHLGAGGASSEELRLAMEQVVEQAHRAGQIIRRLRGFLRKDEPRRDRVQINRAVREAVRLLDQDARTHDVEIELDLAEPLPSVRGDLIELEQVVLNLGKNAIDAMAESAGNDRRLTIETTLV